MAEKKTLEELKALGFDNQKNYDNHIAGKIARGMKWSRIKSDAEHDNDVEKIKWINSQENILGDIKAYEDSLKPAEVVKEKPAEEEQETKSKRKK